MRRVRAVYVPRQVLEGAGVLLRRGFPATEVGEFDPFLLFDDFSSMRHADYAAGFPWHPHRGIETVTYLLDGSVRHKDSLGNEGVIGKNEVQWMTAGRGIIHEEMPESEKGIRGFQLWVNLPQKGKMTAPQYQQGTKDLPEVRLAAGVIARIIAGKIGGVSGEHAEHIGTVGYFDISLEHGREVAFPVPEGDTAFIYLVEGSVAVGDSSYQEGSIALLERTGGEVVVRAPHGDARFLFVHGAPLGEPIAWHGPIVMNTAEEIKAALQDLERGTFILN